MIRINFLMLFFLAFAHFSSGKRCFECWNVISERDSITVAYLKNKLNHFDAFTPKGMEFEQGARLLSVISEKAEMREDIRYFYDFQVKGVTTQEMYICNLVVDKTLWLAHEKLIDYSCQRKPSPPMSSVLAQWEAVKYEEKEEIIPVIDSHTTRILKSKYVMKVLRFINATKDTAGGTVIKTVVELGETNCSSLDIDVRNCHLTKAPHYICEYELRKRMNEITVLYVKCDKKQSKPCVGCFKFGDPTDEFVIVSTNYLLNGFNLKDGKDMTLVKVKEVMYKVESGINYKVDFESKDVKSGSSYNCRTEFFSKLWITKEPIIKSFQCEPIS